MDSTSDSVMYRRQPTDAFFPRMNVSLFPSLFFYTSNEKKNVLWVRIKIVFLERE